VSEALAEKLQHLEASSTSCRAPGLGWLEHWARLGTGACVWLLHLAQASHRVFARFQEGIREASRHPESECPRRTEQKLCALCNLLSGHRFLCHNLTQVWEKNTDSPLMGRETKDWRESFF
jgi:hypothetical protein